MSDGQVKCICSPRVAAAWSVSDKLLHKRRNDRCEKL
jgi:hypothetical protein